ncbi:MAG: chromosome segregation protein SMC, partial [Methylococcales bacterium]|nr:chromosome segregation protein SMC [Methylococcales bacterium]
LLEAEESKIVAAEHVEENQFIQQQLQQTKASWQVQWEDYLSESSKSKEQAEVQKAKLSHLTSQSQQLQQRLEKLQTEHGELSKTDLQSEIESLDSSIELIETDREDLQQQLEATYSQIIEQRQQVKEFHNQLHQDRSEHHKVNGKITSLELLQQHAMGKDKKDLQQWLEQMDLSNNQRLAEFLEVESGWEKSVETVLGSYLEAICMDDIDTIVEGLQDLTEQSVILFETHESKPMEMDNKLTPLLSKISTPWELRGLLSGIYCAEDIVSAKKLCTEIQAYESIITKDGDWVGADWIKISRSSDSKSGVLQREKELRDLKQRRIELQGEVEALEGKLDATELTLKQAESSREDLQQRDKVLGSEYSAKSSQFSAYSAKQEQQQQRLN